jgi:hypothetical protein
VLALQAQHGQVGAYRHDLLAIDRHGLLQWLAWLGGVDLGVVQDHVHCRNTLQRGAGKARADGHLQELLHSVPRSCCAGAPA